MSQRLALDRLIRNSYYGVGAILLLLTSCRARPGLIGPEPLTRLDRETVSGWVTGFRPTQPTRYDLKWTYTTQRGTARGRASVRLVPPDSLRFDYRGPFGRSGAVVIIGDAVLWSEPEEDVAQLLPIAPLFWAALGIPREPAEGSEVYGLETDSERVWQYVVGGDTLSYVATRHAPHTLRSEMRRLGNVVGFVDMQFGNDGMVPVEAVMSFPETATRFILNVENVETVTSFDRETWKRP